LVETISPFKLILAIIFCLLNIPTPICLDVRGYNEINALISTSWTLQFEYLINILYSLIIRRLPTYIIAILSLCSAFLTINLTLNLDVFDVLKSRELRKYTVIGGWELSACELYIGLARLLYPFFVGYLIFRLKLKIKIKYSFLITSLLLTIILCFPRVGGDKWIINGIYESIIILFVFPLIIMVGAGNTENNGNIIKICNILGELSYHLYITHYPLVHCNMAWNCYHSNDKLFNKIGLSIGTAMLIIFNAYASLKLFDEPVRKWLTNKYILKEKKIDKEIIKQKLK
jgi:peptidoglycan/LPS O-acetylase OafA/YrhL